MSEERSVLDVVNEVMSKAESMQLIPMVLIAISEDSKTLATLPFFDRGTEENKRHVRHLLTEALKCCD